MLRTSLVAVLALSLSFGFTPPLAAAQGTCEYAAALSPAMAAAPAIGALGEALTGVFDRANTALDQAIEGNPGGTAPADGAAVERAPTPAPTPRPSAEANVPGPLVVGC